MDLLLNFLFYYPFVLTPPHSHKIEFLTLTEEDTYKGKTVECPQESQLAPARVY